MFFLVILKNSKEKVIVPVKWIQNLDTTKLFNYGIVYMKKKVYKIYFSNKMLHDEPDFQTTILDRIDLSQPACYETKIVQCFGKLIEILLNQ